MLLSTIPETAIEIASEDGGLWDSVSWWMTYWKDIEREKELVHPFYLLD